MNVMFRIRGDSTPSGHSENILQVRSRAVQTLNHSLSIANRTTPFQLKELVDILAFESDSEVPFDFSNWSIVLSVKECKWSVLL